MRRARGVAIGKYDGTVMTAALFESHAATAAERPGGHSCAAAAEQ